MVRPVQIKEPGTAGSAGTAPMYEQLQQQVAELLRERSNRVITRQDAQQALRWSSEYVIDAYEESNEQYYALCSAVVNELTPPDAKNPPDNWHLTAWRIAQALEDLLGHTHDTKVARSFLLGEAA